MTERFEFKFFDLVQCDIRGDEARLNISEGEENLIVETFTNKEIKIESIPFKKIQAVLITDDEENNTKLLSFFCKGNEGHDLDDISYLLSNGNDVNAAELRAFATAIQRRL